MPTATTGTASGDGCEGAPLTGAPASPVTDHPRPHFESAALITIDTQLDTLDGQPFEVSGTTAILPRIRRLVQAFRAAGAPIIHIVRLYKRDGSNVDLSRRR